MDHLTCEAATASNYEIVEAYSEDLGLTGSVSNETVRVYMPDARRAARIFGDMGVTFDQIRIEHLKEFVRRLKSLTERPAGLSCGRMKGIFSQLNSLMEFLVFHEMADYNVVPAFRKRYLRSYKASSTPSTRRRAPSDEELAAMIYSIPDSRDRAIHMLMAKTGISNKDLRELDIGDVDLAGKWVTSKQQDKRSTRMHPMDEECADVLESYFRSLPSYPRREGEQALFTNRDGGRLIRKSVTRIVHKHAQRAGLHDPEADRTEQHRKFGPHHYRHWFTTALSRNGCPPRIIRELRGDSPSEAMDAYDHITLDELQEQYVTHIPRLASAMV